MKSTVVMVLVIIFTSYSVGVWGQNQNLRMDQGRFNDFRRAKRIYYKAHMSFLKKKYDKAQNDFMKCVEVFPEFSEAYYYMSKIDYHNKKYSKALGNIDMANKYFMFMYNLQLTAKTALLRKLRVRKNAIKKRLNNSMSKMDDSTRQELENELLMIDDKLKTPVTIAGEDAHIPSDYFFHKGNVLLRLKKMKEAYKFYVKAIEVEPKNVNAYTNLLALLLSSGNGKIAMKYLNQAKDNGLNINPELKKRILNLAKQE